MANSKDPNEICWVDTGEGEPLAWYGEEYGRLIQCRRPVKMKRSDIQPGMKELNSHMKLIYDTSIMEAERKKKAKEKESHATPPE